MLATIQDYIDSLREKLRNCDPALIQDALSDAEEHLREALIETRESRPGLEEYEALRSVIDSYGTPAEVASAYRETESGRQPIWFPTKPEAKNRSFAIKFFAVLSDSRAWGAFLYFLLAGITGCLYGLWVLFGLSLSLVSLLFILGIPLTGLFLLSLRGIALIEGRIVEALLGIRMPRKPLFVRRDMKWWGRFKALISESQTWRILLYLLLQWPLGLLFCVAALVFFAVSLKCIIYPVWYWGLGRPLITLQSGSQFFPPVWSFPLVVLAGILWLLSTLHLVRRLGAVQGHWAKAMLVRGPEV